ncbi:phage integrase family protein [Sulfuritalea hydrogenivorans sk43H]|uniref:Phage integrase family protein n=1 Tax=Sulfuritalea hydrogenivorans sk43H TaxID=1223802 RepID=W0SAW9_9PROT|nr:phage integrase family protein [Sulfuritalea hydrogenivorans sk43H]
MAFQFRDIRAKAGTEASIAGGMDHAQKLLGHKHVTMTQHYVRARLGESVEPLRRPGIVEESGE